VLFCPFPGAWCTINLRHPDFDESGNCEVFFGEYVASQHEVNVLATLALCHLLSYSIADRSFIALRHGKQLEYLLDIALLTFLGWALAGFILTQCFARENFYHILSIIDFGIVGMVFILGVFAPKKKLEKEDWQILPQ